MRSLRDGVAIGETEIARRLYAGRYAEILAETIDSSTAGSDDVDIAFVVGALCFVGRVEEGELFLENQRRAKHPQGRNLAAGGCFLTIAYARSGDLVRARRTLSRAYRETATARDSWSRAFLFQAIACCHYFAGNYSRAAQAALNAQGSAMEARFAYVQMLATDMRAHVLAQRGDLDSGLRLLEQARTHARHLGFDVNVRVIEASIAIERARIAHPRQATAALERLLEATDIQDGYSRRLLLTQLSQCYSLLGRGDEAHRAIDAAARLGPGDGRAQAALAVARAVVARITLGWAAALSHVAEARRLAAAVFDPPLQAEIAGLELAGATFLGDRAGRDAAIAELNGLLSAHALFRARSWLFQYDAIDDPPDGDQLTRVLRPVVATARLGGASREALQELPRSGLWGLVAEASGMEPGCRIHLFDDCQVLEMEGEVRPVLELPARGRAVLIALGRGSLSKEALLAAVWGLTRYRPERHDSLVKTTISRLRAALGRGTMWIETIEGGYRIPEGIVVLAHGFELGTRDASSLEAQGTPPSGPTVGDGNGARTIRWSRIEHELAAGSERSVAELAAILRASVRTVSRDLSQMLRQGRVARTGVGPGTRYRERRDPKEPHDE